jgi:hypothetical protein
MVGRQTFEIRVVDLAQRAGLDKPTFLALRPRGEQFLPALKEVLADHTAQTVVLDFTGVELITSSFADAVFGQLAVDRSTRSVAPTCLIACSLPAPLQEEIENGLIKRVEQVAKLRNGVLPIYLSTDKVELVGKAEAHVIETFGLLRTFKQLTARTLADEMRLEIGAASTRLKVLYDLGLALRQEVRDNVGKQFIYVWPF